MVQSATLLTTLLALNPLVGGTVPSKFLDHAIDQLVLLHSDGIAVTYPEFRSIKLGHFFGEHSEDAIALFSIEGFHGGNYHGEYLAIFMGVEPERLGRKSTKPYQLIATIQIGGRMWRTFDWKSLQISRGKLTISGKEWVAGKDPACCPSKSFQTTFIAKGVTISESE